MQESTASKVVLTDIDVDTVRAILLYVYLGKVETKDVAVASCIELIHGAEKYDLVELKRYCFDQLCKSMTDETIGSVAVAAEVYDADQNIKECVKEYCQR